MVQKFCDILNLMAAKKKTPKGIKRVQIKIKLSLTRVIVGLLIVFFLFPALLSLLEFRDLTQKLDISTALNEIKDGKVKEVNVQDDKLILIYPDDTIKTTTKESSISFAELLDRARIDPKSVNFKVVDQSASKIVGDILLTLLPIIITVGLFMYILKSQTRGASDLFSFGRSKAKLFAKGKQDITFTDVAGVDDAKKELEEVVDFLKHPEKYRKMGARTPKGVLLFGPAGVGKTLLAKAVAGEAGVPFFSMAGSEFMEMLVGVGASRVRDLFQNAKTAAPAIIFIDEIDAIGRHRGRSGFVGGHDEREQTLNQILVEMDGFTPNDNVVVLAATNRGDLLDPALLRPGRFDRRVTLDMADKDGRLAILKIHAKNKLFAKNINWERIADRTVSFSGADLENMLNEAAISAARAGKQAIEMADVEDAATKVKLGPAKRKIQTDEDKAITAYHEAGHALVSHFLPKTDPVQRISIVARGMSLGHTEITPIADRTHETKSRLLQSITTMLGGRAAEEVVFNELTAGASNDIKNATRYAKAMVVDFGMSDLGPVNLGATTDYGEFGSMDWYEAPSNAPATAQKIDEEVKKIIDVAHKEATTLIKKHKSLLDKVVKALLVKETLDRDEFEKIVGKKS